MKTPSFEDYAPDRSQQFVGTGTLCQHLQVLPGQLRVLMDSTGVKFAMILDGVGYVRVADAERLAAKCRDTRKAIAEIPDRLAAADQN